MWNRYRWIPFIGILLLSLALVACDKDEEGGPTDPGGVQHSFEIKGYAADSDNGLPMNSVQMWVRVEGDTIGPYFTGVDGWTPLMTFWLKEGQSEPSEVHVEARGGVNWKVWEGQVVLSKEYDPRVRRHVWAAKVALERE